MPASCNRYSAHSPHPLGTAQIIVHLQIFRFGRNRGSLLFGLFPAVSSIRDLLLSAVAASRVCDTDVPVHRSAGNCRNFRKTGTVRSAQTLQIPSCFVFLLLSFSGRDHGCHIFYRILSVKNHTFQIQILKSFHHFAVIFSRLSTQMDLTVHPLLPQIYHQCWIRQNKTLKAKIHTASDNLLDHRILFGDVIQGIKGQMHRALIVLPAWQPESPVHCTRPTVPDNRALPGGSMPAWFRTVSSTHTAHTHRKIHPLPPHKMPDNRRYIRVLPQFSYARPPTVRSPDGRCLPVDMLSAFPDVLQVPHPARTENCTFLPYADVPGKDTHTVHSIPDSAPATSVFPARPQYSSHTAGSTGKYWSGNMADAGCSFPVEIPADTHSFPTHSG